MNVLNVGICIKRVPDIHSMISKYLRMFKCFVHLNELQLHIFQLKNIENGKPRSNMKCKITFSVKLHVDNYIQQLRGQITLNNWN